MNKRNEYYIRKANEKDAEEIYEGMKNIYENLDDKSLFVLDDYKFIRKQICEEGFAVVACNKAGRIIGSLIVRYPKMAEDNLGYDIRLAEKEIDKVAHIETAVVDSEFRGHGIQGEMLDYAEKIIDPLIHHYLMATVAPYNPASKKTFLKHGYKVFITKEKYGGVKRDILFKELTT